MRLITTALVLLVSSLISARPIREGPVKGPIEKCLDSHPAICARADYVAARDGILDSASWIIDSGADGHTCNDESLMTDVRHIEGEIGGFAGGKTFVSKAGTVYLTLAPVNGYQHTLELHDVLLVPGDVNLISAERLAQSGIFYRNDREQLFATKPYEVIGQIDRYGHSPILRLAGDHERLRERGSISDEDRQQAHETTTTAVITSETTEAPTKSGNDTRHSDIFDLPAWCMYIEPTIRHYPRLECMPKITKRALALEAGAAISPKPYHSWARHQYCKEYAEDALCVDLPQYQYHIRDEPELKFLAEKAAIQIQSSEGHDQVLKAPARVAGAPKSGGKGLKRSVQSAQHEPDRLEQMVNDAYVACIDQKFQWANGKVDGDELEDIVRKCKDETDSIIYDDRSPHRRQSTSDPTPTDAEASEESVAPPRPLSTLTANETDCMLAMVKDCAKNNPHGECLHNPWDCIDRTLIYKDQQDQRPPEGHGNDGGWRSWVPRPKHKDDWIPGYPGYVAGWTDDPDTVADRKKKKLQQEWRQKENNIDHDKLKREIGDDDHIYHDDHYIIPYRCRDGSCNVNVTKELPEGGIEADKSENTLTNPDSEAKAGPNDDHTDSILARGEGVDDETDFTACPIIDPLCNKKKRDNESVREYADLNPRIGDINPRAEDTTTTSEFTACPIIDPLCNKKKRGVQSVSEDVDLNPRAEHTTTNSEFTACPIIDPLCNKKKRDIESVRADVDLNPRAEDTTTNSEFTACPVWDMLCNKKRDTELAKRQADLRTRGEEVNADSDFTACPIIDPLCNKKRGMVSEPESEHPDSDIVYPGLTPIYYGSPSEPRTILRPTHKSGSNTEVDYAEYVDTTIAQRSEDIEEEAECDECAPCPMIDIFCNKKKRAAQKEIPPIDQVDNDATNSTDADILYPASEPDSDDIVCPGHPRCDGPITYGPVKATRDAGDDSSKPHSPESPSSEWRNAGVGPVLASRDSEESLIDSTPTRTLDEDFESYLRLVARNNAIGPPKDCEHESCFSFWPQCLATGMCHRHPPETWDPAVINAHYSDVPEPSNPTCKGMDCLMSRSTPEGDGDPRPVDNHNDEERSTPFAPTITFPAGYPGACDCRGELVDPCAIACLGRSPLVWLEDFDDQQDTDSEGTEVASAVEPQATDCCAPGYVGPLCLNACIGRPFLYPPPDDAADSQSQKGHDSDFDAGSKKGSHHHLKSRSKSNPELPDIDPTCLKMPELCNIVHVGPYDGVSPEAQDSSAKSESDSDSGLIEPPGCVIGCGMHPYLPPPRTAMPLLPDSTSNNGPKDESEDTPKSDDTTYDPCGDGSWDCFLNITAHGVLDKRASSDPSKEDIKDHIIHYTSAQRRSNDHVEPRTDSQTEPPPDPQVLACLLHPESCEFNHIATGIPKALPVSEKKGHSANIEPRADNDTAPAADPYVLACLVDPKDCDSNVLRTKSSEALPVSKQTSINDIIDYIIHRTITPTSVPDTEDLACALIPAACENVEPHSSPASKNASREDILRDIIHLTVYPPNLRDPKGLVCALNPASCGIEAPASKSAPDSHKHHTWFSCLFDPSTCDWKTDAGKEKEKESPETSPTLPSPEEAACIMDPTLCSDFDARSTATSKIIPSYDRLLCRLDPSMCDPKADDGRDSPEFYHTEELPDKCSEDFTHWGCKETKTGLNCRCWPNQRIEDEMQEELWIG